MVNFVNQSLFLKYIREIILFQVTSLSDQEIKGENSEFISITSMASIKIAVPGHCEPRRTCVPNPLLQNLSSSSEIAFPTCIDIFQCGGCCPMNLNCKAVAFEDINFRGVYHHALIFHKKENYQIFY